MKQVVLAMSDEGFPIVKRFRRVVEHEVLLNVQAGSLQDALDAAQAYEVPDDYVEGSPYKLISVTHESVRINDPATLHPTHGQGPLDLVVFDTKDAFDLRRG